MKLTAARLARITYQVTSRRPDLDAEGVRAVLRCDPDRPAEKIIETLDSWAKLDAEVAAMVQGWSDLEQWAAGGCE